VDIRRVEGSPTPLKRDRSFSEHDLEELRGEVMSEPLRGERPRSHTLTGPPHIYQGQTWTNRQTRTQTDTNDAVACSTN